jgi:lysozyme
MELRGSNSLKGMLPPILDLEKKKDVPVSPTILKEALRFIAKVKRELTPEVEPIIYTGTGFWDIARVHEEKLAESSFSKTLLWAADYNTYTQKKEPPLPNGGWPTWIFWQFHGSDNNIPIEGVGGKTGHVDYNVFHGGLDDLKKLIIK